MMKLFAPQHSNIFITRSLKCLAVWVMFLTAGITAAHAVPPTPTGVTATAGVGQVTVSWQSVPNVTKYLVRRSTSSGGSYSEVASLAPSILTFNNTGLKNGTTYYYVVIAVDKTGKSAPSSPPQPATPYLVPPTGVAAAPGSRRVQLTWNTASGAANYRVRRASTSGGPYTQVANITTTSYLDTDLVNGQNYFYVVASSDSNSISANSGEVPVTPFLSAPTNLAVTNESKTVTLSWAAVLGAQKYQIFRSQTSGAGYEKIETQSGTTYRDNAVANGETYYYVVKAVDQDEVSSTSSEVVGQPDLPPPSNFKAEISSRQVELSWDEVPYADSYKIKRSTTSGGPDSDPYVTIKTTSELTFLDTDVKNNVTYYYVIQALDGNYKSLFSAEISAMPELLPPTNVIAKAQNLQITLTWNAVKGIEKYKVRRSTTSGGPYSNGVTVTEPTFVDSDLNNGTPYYYVVQSVDGDDKSPNSIESTATPKLLPPYSVQAKVADRQVVLSWDDVPFVDSYIIKRADILAGPYKNIGTSLTATYTNSGLRNGRTYYYAVVAVDGDKKSPDSTPVSATPQIQAPSNLKATPGNQQVALTWTAATGATSYTIYRSLVAGGPYTKVVKVSGTSYTNTGLKNGTTYYYVLTSYNGVDTSATSVEVNAKPASVSITTSLSAQQTQAAPTALTAMASGKFVSLQWQTVSGANSYNVWRASSSGGEYENVGTAQNGEFVDKSTNGGKTYFYVVTAVGSSESTPSEEASVKTGN